MHIFFAAMAFSTIGSLASAQDDFSARNPNAWMAVVGDSGVTGAASATGLEPTLSSLIDRFLSPVPELGLARVPYSANELRKAGFQAPLLKLGYRLAQRLDVQESSFGYRVGRRLGMKAQDILMVGQDGVLVSTIATQFERIFETKTRTLPPLVLLSYTANDMCDPKIFAQPLTETSARFQAALAKTWQETMPFLKPHPNGTKIVVLAPMDVANVIANPEILAQKIDVEGHGEITCGQLRRGETRFTISSWPILRMLNLMCPSVTQTELTDTARLRRLRAVQDAYGDKWKSQVRDLNLTYGKNGIQWTYVDEIRGLRFKKGDVANDCFHPSASGHAKIADLLLKLKLF